MFLKIKTKKYCKKAQNVEIDLKIWLKKKKKVENQGECKKEFIKIRLEWDDNLSLNKKLKLHNLTIVVNSVF